MKLRTILALGRMSNLPTVWTNALAGAVLAAAADVRTVVLAGLALTAFYVGGMWLNDAFDAEIDAREKADRPIPRGEAARRTVFLVGFGLLGLGVVISFILGTLAGLFGIALAGFVLAYDALHKKTALSPVLMGATRFCCYLLPAATVGFGPQVMFGAMGLFAYIVGLTYAAKQEAYNRIGATWPLAVLSLPVVYAIGATVELGAVVLFALGFAVVILVALGLLLRRARGDVPRAVVTMIAGISLYDAALIASMGVLPLAMVAVAGFGATLALQRLVSGT